MKITASIIDYLGKMGDGILTQINLTFEGKNYDGTFFYTSDRILITVSDEFIKNIGKRIELHEDYESILTHLINSAEPFENIINEIEEFNPQS